jgi:hypothetical protein
MPAATFDVVALGRAAGGGALLLQKYSVVAGVASFVSSAAAPANFDPDYCMLRTWPGDRTHIYIGGVLLGTGTAEVWYSSNNGSSWTRLISVTGTNNFSFVVDMCFPSGAENMVCSIGTWNAKGQSFHQSLTVDAVAGIYKSVGGGALALQGTGNQHGFNGGNINHPNTVIALCVHNDVVDTFYTLHAQTPSNVSMVQSVIDFAPPALAVWNAIAASFVGGFEYWCLGVIEYHPEWPSGNLFFLGDRSGTGPYSFPTSDTILNYDPVSAIYTTKTNPTISGVVGGNFYDGSSKGFILDTNGVMHVYQMVTQGVVGTERIVSTPSLQANWRTFAVHDSFPFGLIGYHGVAGGNGMLVWTDDAADSFHTFVTTGFGISALDFGVTTAPPPAPGPWPTTLTFRDSMGLTGRSTYFTLAPDAATARTQAIAIGGHLNTLSVAHLQAGIGAWSLQPILTVDGAQADYEPIEQRLVLVFNDANGGIISIEVPAPTASVFTSAGDIVDTSSLAITTAAADMITNQLCGRGGNVAVSFLGGRRTGRPPRRKFNIFTTDPAETGPGL